MNSINPAEFKILVVDDDAEVVMGTTRLLAKAGYVVASAADGIAALQAMQTNPPDLLLLDRDMPRLDGLEACRRIKADPALAGCFVVLASSTYVEAGDRVDGFEAGADGYILRSIANRELLARVNGYVRLIDITRRLRVQAEELRLEKEVAAQSQIGSLNLAEDAIQARRHAEDLNRQLSESLKALQQSEQKVRALVQSAFDAIVTADGAGNIIGWNQAAAEMFGYAEAEIKGQPMARLMPERFREAHRAGIQRVGSGGERRLTGAVEVAGLHKDGREFPIELAISGWQIGADTFYSGIIRNIAGRKAAEARLNLQSAALDAAANVIIITDTKGTIEWVNDAFTRITGYTSQEAVGHSPRVLKSGQHPPEFYQEMWRTISSGQVWHGEIHNQRKDGSPLEEDATITPVKDAAGVITHYIAIKQDITEKKALEKQFLRAQRMESVGMLAGGIAHDLNNVLAPISMGLELLQQVPLPDKIRPVIDSMLTSTQRGAGIVKQVLTFARGTDGERAIVQLRHLIKDIRRMAEETFPRNITLHSDVAADLWPLKADTSQLHQVLLNLSVNARDALPDGGQIRYSAQNLHLDEAAVLNHPGAKPGDYVLLKVTDTGTGMPPGVVERIFDPFFTTKPHGQGTGLGLPTVLGIIRSHGGLIEVQSVPGKGTTFEVYLPADQSSATVAGPARAEPLRSGHGETILVVDDEPAVLAVTRSMLEGHGYRVLVAEDGAAAVAVYAQHAQQIAVVVTDIMMPLMDGVALVRSLQRLNSQVRIITVSGLSNQPGQPERHTELRSKGIRHHLDKPFSVEALLNALHEELHPAGPGN
jgi:two-component system, cell cycle sensor histidine kinase and response regulator CckA